MQRVVKQEGPGNIMLEEVDRPQPSPTQVLIQAHTSLISRGSELWRRYIREEAIDPSIMGYSMSGTIAEVGSAVELFEIGDRVAALAPHAEYVVMDTQDERNRPRVVHLPDDVSFEQGTFWPLCTSCVCWTWAAQIQPGETVVVLGQGLVGSLMLQVVRPWGPGHLIAVDALPMRCDMALRLGADEAIDVTQDSPAKVLHALTSGRGADVVIEAVGGPRGVEAFRQGIQLIRSGGRIVLIGLYQGADLPLDAAQLMTKQIVGANQYQHQREHASRVALQMLSTGMVRASEMITHRFQHVQAKVAFDLLYERPEEALGVLLQWQE